MALENQSVIVKKVVEEGGHGHHGGAWKVAYADFVTAMMAFFLLLWLLSTSSKDTLKGLAEFFSDAQQNRGEPGGVGGVLEGLTVTPFTPIQPQSRSPLSFKISVPRAEEREEMEPTFALELGADPEQAGQDPRGQLGELERFWAAREEQQFRDAEEAIREALESSPELQAYRDHLHIERTPEGLRIEILDQERTPMFPVGSDRMYPVLHKLLQVVAKAVRDLPNRLSIRGHTDARPFPPGADMDNWKLSANRANAARRVLVEAGVPAERVAEVIGKAETEPLVPEDPMDARNRRISIVLLTQVRRQAATLERDTPAAVPAEGSASLLPPDGTAAARPVATEGRSHP